MAPATPRAGLRISPAIHPIGVPTRAACEAAVALGISLDALDRGATETPDPIDLELRPGAVALITGPSGAGKSTLLRAIAAEARDRDWTVIEDETPRVRAALRSARATVDLLGADARRAMRALARAGLGEAGVFVRRARELSEGQRARLRLALAMERARRAAQRSSADTTLLSMDEFASGLDRVTACAVARLVTRFAGESGVRVVLASARDDLETATDAPEIISIDAPGQARVTRVRSRLDRWPVGVRLVEGAISDYDALAALHYRAGRPATAALTLTARDERTNDIAGVLVVSHPTLNAAWRDHAWPGRFSGPDRRRAARRLNRELRCVSRVIVDPRYRSLGIARGLVRAYLDRPLTPRTEAVAAMGAVCPFFEAAGMRRVDTPPSERDRRLLETLEDAGLARWRLATPRAAWDCVTRAGHADRVERALRAWAMKSRASRDALRRPIQDLFARACRDVGSSTVAYVSDRNPSEPSADAAA